MRFLRADGSLIGTVGGPARQESAAKESRESVRTTSAAPASVSGGMASHDDARNDSSKGEPCSPTVRVDPWQEQDALLALRGLEFPVRRAKSLLRRVLSEQPAARAKELVRAVLLRQATSRTA